jgi:hypothetical protein
MAFGQDQVSLTRGDVMLDATDLRHTADMHDSVVTLVRLPRPVAADLAEEHTACPPPTCASSRSPRSRRGGRAVSTDSLVICRQLITSGITEISLLVAHNMTRFGAATLLEAFPNITMTASYIPDPGQMAPSAVRRAAERLFISVHTVNAQIRSIYRKLGVSSRKDAVQKGNHDRPAGRVTGVIAWAPPHQRSPASYITGCAAIRYAFHGPACHTRRLAAPVPATDHRLVLDLPRSLR